LLSQRLTALQVLASFPVARLRRSTLVVDVLSVKARMRSMHRAASASERAAAELTICASQHMASQPQVFPKNLFLTKLPGSCDILCLHPMFGPESGKGAWTGLPLVYDRVRVREAAPARSIVQAASRCPSRLSAYRRRWAMTPRASGAAPTS
jgi:arogenate dehydrogenase (NADP+)